MHAADAEISRVHARARGALVEHHQLLALLEAPQRRGQRADVHRLRGDVEEVRQQPPDLAIEHADQLRAARHLQPEQLLRREAEGVLLVHRRDIVEPVEIRDRLQIGLVLDQLLGAAMQQADMRIDALDHLAVELQHEAQHAVRRRMLRPEVDGEVARAERSSAIMHLAPTRRLSQPLGIEAIPGDIARHGGVSVGEVVIAGLLVDEDLVVKAVARRDRRTLRPRRCKSCGDASRYERDVRIACRSSAPPIPTMR